MDKKKKTIKNNYAHISVILDRTGSMESIRDDTIGGFNAFLGEQKKQKGKATLTLVQFDSQDPYEVVHRFKAIKEVPVLTRESYPGYLTKIKVHRLRNPDIISFCEQYTGATDADRV
ncbi:MAG: hypothetical protein ABIN18_03960 [Pseudomonadota bacterium]